MYKIQVIKTKTGEVTLTMKEKSLRAAERVERGVNINLNHAEFHTKIVEDATNE